MIKNLLQLRENISYYDSKFLRSTRNVKLADIFQAIRVVLSNPLDIQNYGDLAKPFIATQQDDVRQILDQELKTSCETFILETSKASTEPLLQFLNEVTMFLAKNSRGELYNQPFASKGTSIVLVLNLINLCFIR
jgi:hypothetical protein